MRSGGLNMRLQLFKGTYGILMLFAVIGLFLMLRRQGGDANSLLLWLGLVILAAGGLVATRSDLTAFVGAGVGLLSTLYLRLAGLPSLGGEGVSSAAKTQVELALGAYLLIAITLAVIWGARRRSRIR